MKQSSSFGLWVGALVVILIVVFVVIKIAAGPASSGGTVAPVSENDWTLGRADASATLIEYSDFQCPACKTYHPILAQLRGEFGQSLRFVYRHFPLRQIHPNAGVAAEAAEAAGKQGKFWEMHDMLFDRQTSWADLSNPEDTFVGYAGELGLNTEQFRTDFNSSEVKDAVRADEDSGTQVAITGTPTLFLNGARIENLESYEQLRQLVIDAGGTVQAPSFQTKPAE